MAALRQLVIVVTLAAAAFAVARAVAPAPTRLVAAARPAAPVDPQRQAHFVGVETCAECHAEKAQSYVETSHYLAMRRPEPELMRETLAAAGCAAMPTRDPRLAYELVEQDDDFSWTSVDTVDGPEIRRRERVELVMGSGKMALAYFYRQGLALYQMPVVFLGCLDNWANPPGYLDTWARWDRPITARCLECHSTYFEKVPGTTNCYFPETAILSITCERCHGPGSAHVDHMRAYPDATENLLIVNPKRLSQRRHLDVCAQCHGELGRALQPAFSYLPGDPLEEYLEFSGSEELTNEVHTVNQTLRLEQSACFRGSPSMNCVTCHDPHVDQRGQVEIFSAQCRKCHEVGQCGASQRLGDSIAGNCIDCHMPVRDDQSLNFYDLAGDKLKLVQLRDHLIGLYPEESSEIEAHWHTAEMDTEPLERSYQIARRRLADSALQRGRALLEAGQSEQAERIWRLAIARLPDRHELRLALGEQLVANGQHGEAVEVFEPAAEAAARSAAASEAWGWALTQIGRTVDAVACYRAALDAGTASVTMRNRLAWLLATEPADEVRDGNQAEALSRQLVAETAAGDWNVLDTQAAALAELGRWEEAISTAEEALNRCRAAAGPTAPLEGRLENYRRHETFRRGPLQTGDVK